MDQVRMIHGSCRFSMGSTLRFSHFLPGGEDVFPNFFLRERLQHNPLEAYLEPNMRTCTWKFKKHHPFLMGKDRCFLAVFV